MESLSNIKSNKRYPLVSCIMPTKDRRKFIPLAIRNFIRQDYPYKELIIVDDGKDKIFDLVPKGDSITYLNLDESTTIGKKRNIAIEASQGEIIFHWDDDDWFAPYRISLQVHSIISEDKDINGVNKIIFLDATHAQAWLYEYLATDRPWVAGGSLCYKKKIWENRQFDDLTYGEDTQFLWSQKNLNIYPIPDFYFYVAIIHNKNTISKNMNSNCYRRFPLRECQKIMGNDYKLYSGIEKEAQSCL